MTRKLAARLPTWAAITLALATTAGGIVVSRAAPAYTPAESLAPPKHVTSAGRAELKARMGRHGNTMSKLVRGVVLLDRPTVRTLAGRIADEELVAAAPRGKLVLPREIFTEQSALRTAAQQLALAAVDGSDDALLADRFATIARTCVSCHSVYLHGHP